MPEIKQKLLKRFPDVEVILYGSKARSDDEKFSDTDLLILIDSQVIRRIKEDITEITYDFEKEDVEIWLKKAEEFVKRI